MAKMNPLREIRNIDDTEAKDTSVGGEIGSVLSSVESVGAHAKLPAILAVPRNDSQLRQEVVEIENSVRKLMNQTTKPSRVRLEEIDGRMVAYFYHEGQLRSVETPVGSDKLDAIAELRDKVSAVMNS